MYVSKTSAHQEMRDSGRDPFYDRRYRTRNLKYQKRISPVGFEPEILAVHDYNIGRVLPYTTNVHVR